MPTVQTYGARKVASDSLPGARKSASETPTSLGVGLEHAKAQTAEVVGGIAGAVARLGAEQFTALEVRARERANDLAQLTSDRQLDDWERLKVHDPEQGVFHTVKGKDAVGMPSTVLADFDKEADRIETGLNAEQRDAFRARRHIRRASLARSLESYSGEQLDAYETAETHAALIGSQQSAIANTVRDPLRISEELARTEAIVNNFADHDGAGPAVRALLLTKARTTIHAGVIDQQLAIGNDKDAQTYFDAVKQQIAPEALPEIERKLESGSTAGNGLRAAELIWQQQGPKGDTDPIQLDHMETAARAQFADDPKTLAATMHYLRERKAGVDASRQDRAESTTGAVWVAASNGASLAQISRLPEFINSPGRLQAQITDYIVARSERAASREAALEGRAAAAESRAYTREQRGQAAKETAGWARYWDLSDPKTLNTTSENALQALRGELGDDHVNRLLTQKRAIDKSETTVRAAAIDDDLFKTTAREAGFDAYSPKTDVEKADLGQLKNMVETAIDLEQQRTGKALTRDQKQAVMRSITDQKVMLNVWGTDPARVAAMVVNPADRKKAYVPIAQVPVAALSEAFNYVRGLTPETQRMPDEALRTIYSDRIQRAYALKLLGGTRAEMEAIMRGEQ